MPFSFEVYGKIARPVAEVFRAVTDPSELSSYFTTGGASAPLREGATVTWNFADFPGAFPVHVVEELRRGYRLRDRVIRPALVAVAEDNGAPEPTDQPIH